MGTCCSKLQVDFMILRKACCWFVNDGRDVFAEDDEVSPYVSSQTIFLFHSSYKQSWVYNGEFCSPDFDFELVVQWHQLIVTPVQKSLFLWHETLHKRWGTRKPQGVLLCEAFKSLLVWRRDSVCYSICTHSTALSGEDIHCSEDILCICFTWFWTTSVMESPCWFWSYVSNMTQESLWFMIAILKVKVNEMRWNEIR
jgi:hypothetical protein